MVNRFVPPGDLSQRKFNPPVSSIQYSDLKESLKDKIAEADPTEHELLFLILRQIQKINLHLMGG